MIVLYIIGGIIVIAVLLLQLSLTLYVKQNEDLSIKFGVGGIKLWLINPNEPEEAPEEISDMKVENSDEKPKTKKKHKKAMSPRGIKKLIGEKLSGNSGEKRSIGEVVELALEMIKAALPHMGNILKSARITNVNVKINVGAENADDTAYAYTAVSTGVYALLAVLDENMVVHVKKIELNADFISGEIREDISFKVKIRISVILYNALRIGIQYLQTVKT